MDVLIVNLIVAFACALCIKYIANSQINKFIKFFALLFFIVFILFGFFVFVFFLTFFFLALITKKYKVKIHKTDEKITYEKIEVSKGDKFLFQNKTHFIVTLITLFLTYGFVFDGFKMLKFRYECNIKKDFKIEIISDDYEIKESDYVVIKKDFPYTYTLYPDSNISFSFNNDLKSCYNSTLLDLSKKCGESGYRYTIDIFYKNSQIAKEYEYFMPFNYFMAKMQSVETNIYSAKCGYKHNEIIDILKQNLINKNFNERIKDE